MKIQPLAFFASLLCFLSCSENQSSLPEPETQLNQSGKIEYLESSSSHSGKTFDSQWSVTRKILRGGKQEGVELLTLDNGKLQISIIPAVEWVSFDIRSAGSPPGLGFTSQRNCPSIPHQSRKSEAGSVGSKDLMNGWFGVASNLPDIQERTNLLITPVIHQLST